MANANIKTSTLARILLASFCVASACTRGPRSEHGGPTTEKQSPPGASSSSVASSGVAPDLENPLRVVPLPPKPGEPIALIGGKGILCAQRHEAPYACLGRLTLRLLRPKQEDWPLYPDGEKAKAPLGLIGRDLSRLDAHSWSRCIIEEGSAYCWGGVSDSRDIVKLPLGVEDAVEVRTLGLGQQAVRTKNGDYVQLQVQPCKERPAYGGGPRTPAGLGKVRKILGGDDFECVVTVNNTVSCWGQVGGPEKCTEEAVTIEGLTDIVDGATGLYSACLIRADNRVLCFGDNRAYGLGVPPDELPKSYTPVEVAGVYPAVKIDGLDEEYVALGANGEVWAWGSYLDQEKNGHARRFDMPRPAIDVAVLDGMFCALLDDHSLHCGGDTVRRGLAAGTGRPAFESKELWVNAVTHKIVELIDDDFGGPERFEAQQK